MSLRCHEQLLVAWWKLAEKWSDSGSLEWVQIADWCHGAARALCFLEVDEEACRAFEDAEWLAHCRAQLAVGTPRERPLLAAGVAS